MNNSVNFKFNLFWCFITVLLMVFFPKEVRAYLDPGTGSFLTQVIIASIMALLMVIRTFRHKIIGVFTRTRKPDSASGVLPNKNVDKSLE